MPYLTRLVLLLVGVGMATVQAQSLPLGLDLHVPTPDRAPAVPTSIARGRQLFFDARLSRDGSTSCATCHQPGKAFSDGRVVSLGVGGARGSRNAPPLLNLAYARSLFWDGRASTLEQVVRMPIEMPHEMDLSLTEAAERVGLNPQEVIDGLAAYLRSVFAGGSRFDRFIAGQRSALSEEERAGLDIFRGKGGCATCHAGPTLSDAQLHNTGVAWRRGAFTDEGAGAGRFRTPTLREVTRTAPYMHDGSMPSLEAVVDYYDRGGNRHGQLDTALRPLALSPAEKRALLMFLGTLEGEICEGVFPAAPRRLKPYDLTGEGSCAGAR